MTRLYKLALIALFSSLIAACGGGGGGGGSSSTSAGTSSSTTPVAPSGSTSSSSSGTSSSTPTVAHTLQLSWTMPTTRADGTALPSSDLAGYQIYYYQDGSSAGAGNIVNINNGSTTTASVTINGSGTYYFAIAALDTSGLLSNLSNYVPVTLN